MLYQIVQEYWSEFQAELAKIGKYLLAYVIKEFDVHGRTNVAGAGRAGATHMIFLDGVYTGGHNGIPICFRPVKVPNRAELTRLKHTIAQRVDSFPWCIHLKRLLLVRRWVCWIEEINSITTQICCFHFGNGMVGLIPGSEIGENPIYSANVWV